MKAFDEFKFENAKPREVKMCRVFSRVYPWAVALYCVAIVSLQVLAAHRLALRGALGGGGLDGTPLWQYPILYVASLVGLVGCALVVPLRDHSPQRVRWGMGLTCVAGVALLVTHEWPLGIMLGMSAYFGGFTNWDKGRQAQAGPKAGKAGGV